MIPGRHQLGAGGGRKNHMADEKDRLGDKLHDVEAAREDQWARQRDAELMEKMRQKKSAAVHCPRCGKDLVAKKQGSVQILACPADDGAWLDAAALKALLKR
jgi:hypothetical protein